MKKCVICNKTMRLYSEEKLEMEKLDAYAYSSRKIPEYMHYMLWECEDCRMLISENSISNAELWNNYSKAEYDSSTESAFAAKTYMKYLKRYHPEYGKEKTLDIGAGDGAFMSCLKAEGVGDVQGVEPSQAPLAIANPLIKEGIRNALFNVNDYEKESYDMVSLFQTIEHIPDSEKLLKDMRALLKPNGFAYIVCHDYRSIANRVLGMKSPIYDIEHLQIFSQKSILRIAEKAGYSDIRIFTIENCYPIKYWLRLLPIPNKIKHKIISNNNTKGILNRSFSINVGNIGLIALR